MAYTIDQLKTALIKADAEGDVAGATIIAQEIQKLQQPKETTIDKDYAPGGKFGAPLTSMKLPENYTEADIPQGYEAYHDPEQGNMLRKKEEEASFGEKLVGAGEAALSTGTAMTTGAAGQIYGTLKGIAQRIKNAISSGEKDPYKAAKLVEEEAQKYAKEFTYEPATEKGKEYTQDIAETLAPLEALTPIGAELGAVTRNVKTALPKKTPKPKVEPTTKIEGEIGGTTLEGIAKMSVDAATGNKKAKAKLAQEVKMNPEAVDAADRLGIELSSDILGDNTLIKQTAGLVRSQVGEESAKFADMIDNAITKSDEAFSVLEQSDLATMSGKVMDSFNKSIKDLDTSASNIYKTVTNTIPKNTEVQLVNSVDTVTKYLDDLGISRDKNGKLDLRGLTREEKELYRLVTSDKVTFGALERERRAIGEALGKLPTGKYVNADKSLLKSIYSALKKDQLDNVENILGKDARDQLHLADRTFQKKIALQDRAAEIFGKEGEKSIAALLRRSMVQGSKGDITALNKVFKNVPVELQREVITSAIGDVITSKNGRFNFNDYVKLYTGLRKNAPVYSKIIKTIGSDKDKLLKDLYVISKRITEAKNKIITTGKANQQILKQIQEEALLQRVIKFTVEKGVQKITFGGLTPSLDALFKSPKDKIKAIGDLFNSQEFKDLAVSAINETPGVNQVKKLTNSKVFKDWVKATGNTMKDPEGWILMSLTQKEGESNENNK